MREKARLLARVSRPLAQAEEFKSGEFGDFIYGATQYVAHTLVEKNAIVGEIVKIDEKPLKVVENKIFCIETLKWVKALLKIKEASYEITKFLYTENARFAPNPYVWGMLNKNLAEAEIAEKKFILQYRKPGESRIISQSEVGERLGVAERDFFDEMRELGAEIELALTGGKCIWAGGHHRGRHIKVRWSLKWGFFWFNVKTGKRWIIERLL